jgi:hypothetical protein
MFLSPSSSLSSIAPKETVNIVEVKQDLPLDPLVMEHIYPVSRGGKVIAENLALACQTCNNCKYTKITALDSTLRLNVAFPGGYRQHCQMFQTAANNRIQGLT